MMHEEFIRLSKVETTANYYREVIEPQYAKANLDKEAFIELWLKGNKIHIVKAHAFDIDRANRELALAKCKAAELEEVKAENGQLHITVEHLETKFKAANSSWQEEKHMVEAWKADCYEARKQAEQIEPLKTQISELENEVIRLKARLFDLMEAK